MNLCYLGLGSNLGKPVEQLQQALIAIKALPHTSITACSSFYASKPMGPQDQPDYVNAVISLKTGLDPFELLAELQNIEQTSGRQRKGERWGPRTLDLDILLFGDKIIDDPILTVPHYGMKTREFVLYPLAEIASDLIFPNGEILENLLQNCQTNGLKKITSGVELI